MTSSPHAHGDPVIGAAPQPIAIVAGHGEFAAGLISAVAQITGRGELLFGITNRELGPADIEAAMRAAAGAASIRVIFTDLPAGSCTIAARRLLRERTDLLLVTGANLPVVIDFVLGADTSAPTADAAEARSEQLARAVAHAVERGRASLQTLAPPASAASPTPAPVAAEARGGH